jgi:hypothetical protein
MAELTEEQIQYIFEIHRKANRVGINLPNLDFHNTGSINLTKV